MRTAAYISYFTVKFYLRRVYLILTVIGYQFAVLFLLECTLDYLATSITEENLIRKITKSESHETLQITCLMCRYQLHRLSEESSSMRKYYGPLLGHTASKITAFYVLHMLVSVLQYRWEWKELFCLIICALFLLRCFFASL